MLPKLPKFVIENVPPATSSGFNWRERARVARSTIDRLQASYVLFVRISDDRNNQATFKRHRDSEIDVSVIDDVFAVNRSVEDREMPAALRR